MSARPGAVMCRPVTACSTVEVADRRGHIVLVPMLRPNLLHDTTTRRVGTVGADDRPLRSGMDTVAPPFPDWPPRIYPVMRGLVALASLDLTGHLQAGAPRPRATPTAIAAFEQTTGRRLDPGHCRFLAHVNGWPTLWPVNLFGLPELSNRRHMTQLTTELSATGDLASARLEPDDVYPVAWARTGGTAVTVRPGRDRAGEVIWCEGITTSVYAGFDTFFDAVAARLIAVCGPLAGGTPEAGIA